MLILASAATPLDLIIAIAGSRLPVVAIVGGVLMVLGVLSLVGWLVAGSLNWVPDEE